MKTNKIIIFIIILSFFLSIWFLGPKPAIPDYHTQIPSTLASANTIDSLLNVKEAHFSLKPNNQASIVWANDSIHQSTEYVVLYLHGFGASHEEGNTVHRHFAKKYACNLLLTRLYDHGLTDSLPMQGFTVQKYWNDALEYLSMARILGKKIIVIGTSTGGTLALQMAALFQDVDAVILLSPNIRVNSYMAFFLNDHWGLQIAQMITGRDKMVSNHPAQWYSDYWYRQYSMNAIAEMQQLLETSMKPSLFKKVHQPVLLLYYYKDEENQDNVVSVEAMMGMFDQLGTPEPLKVKKAIPDAGDHVIGCYLRSGDVEGVMSAMDEFAEKILKMNDHKNHL